MARRRDEPTTFFLTTLPRRCRRSRSSASSRSATAPSKAYEELKGELGLDHFEGRSFPGWHHHVSVVLCATPSSWPNGSRLSPLGRTGG